MATIFAFTHPLSHRMGRSPITIGWPQSAPLRRTAASDLHITVECGQHPSLRRRSARLPAEGELTDAVPFAAAQNSGTAHLASRVAGWLASADAEILVKATVQLPKEPDGEGSLGGPVQAIETVLTQGRVVNTSGCVLIGNPASVLRDRAMPCDRVMTVATLISALEGLPGVLPVVAYDDGLFSDRLWVRVRMIATSAAADPPQAAVYIDGYDGRAMDCAALIALLRLFDPALPVRIKDDADYYEPIPEVVLAGGAYRGTSFDRDTLVL